MEKVIHRAGDRGKGEYGWLSTRYSFSFARWYEPTRMGFGTLRVLNDDQIAPHSGFDTHAHQDMEIITFVLSGTLTHKDSMGNTGVIAAGEVQVMSAGTGVAHSERNEGDEPVSLFQIWMLPKVRGITPRYAERSFLSKSAGALLLVAPEGNKDALTINQDAYISRVALDAKHSFEYVLNNPKNGVYIFVVEGTVQAADEMLQDRDAVGITGTSSLELTAPQKAVALVFEVPVV